MQSFASLYRLIYLELTILSGYFLGEMMTMDSSYGRTPNIEIMTMVKLHVTMIEYGQMMCDRG